MPAEGLHPAAPARLVVYGDSNCVDDAHARGERHCLALFDAMLAYLLGHDAQARSLVEVRARRSRRPGWAARPLTPDAGAAAGRGFGRSVAGQPRGPTGARAQGDAAPVFVGPGGRWASPPTRWAATFLGGQLTSSRGRRRCRALRRSARCHRVPKRRGGRPFCLRAAGQRPLRSLDLNCHRSSRRCVRPWKGLRGG